MWNPRCKLLGSHGLRLINPLAILGLVHYAHIGSLKFRSYTGAYTGRDNISAIVDWETVCLIFSMCTRMTLTGLMDI